MLKRMLTVALAVSALGISAPAALADHAIYDCVFDAFSEASLTGGQDVYTGTAEGYVVSPGPEAVSISCVIVVDGTEVASTGTGSGTSFASTTGTITFLASDTQDVWICAEVTAGTESYRECFESQDMQIPPQEVIDVGHVFDGPILCGMPPGDYPPDLTIGPDGDIYRGGTKVYDCPPYGNPPSYPGHKGRH